MQGARGSRLWWAGLSLLIAACASTQTSPSEDAGGGGGDSAGTGSVSAAGEPATDTCSSGATCNCADGAVGQTKCDHGSSTCDCPVCSPPDFPLGLGMFGACGGDPAGAWRLKTYDLGDVAAHFAKGSFTGDALMDAACPAMLDVLTPPSFNMALNSNKTAQIGFHEPEVSAVVLESCIQSGTGLSCKQTPNCTVQDCGTCLCDLKTTSFVSENEHWSSSDSTLKVGTLNFDFCRRGDTLLLRRVEDRARFELELVPEPTCTGTPAGCDFNKTEKECALVPGCAVQPACVGSAVRVCDSMVDVCALCPAGCQCTAAAAGPSSCSGEVHCGDLTHESDCLGLGCTWKPFVACAGTPKDCSSSSVEQCRFTPGCNVR